MPQPKFEPSRSLVALDQPKTLIAVVELSLSTWLVGGMVPGIDRDPLKKLATPDAEALLRLLYRWRDEAVKAGKTITRIVVGYEAVATGSGWHGGRVPAGSKLMSSIRRALPFRGSTGARRPIGLISDCSSFLSSAGCGARKNTAAWWPFRHWRKRMRNVHTRTRAAGWETHWHYQSGKSHLHPARHPGVQAKLAQSTGTSCRAAHAGGQRHPTQHARRTAT